LLQGEAVLTKDQKKAIIHAYMCQIYVMDGIPPTIRTICQDCGIPSTSHVNGFLKELHAAGLLRKVRRGNTARYVPEGFAVVEIQGAA
jgi:SOS-response transcriptional repressor LexA